MKKLIFLSIIFLLNSSLLFSQIAINSDGSPPHPSAGLDVNFTNKGFLLPRMTYMQRNAIQNPAEGLLIYCTDCEADASGALSIFSGGLWRIFNLNCTAPNAPSSGIHVPAVTQITWNWNTVPIALGYKWNITNDYSTATEMLAVTSKTETGLTCNSSYTRYVWAYNECGPSLVLTLTQSTLQIPFSPAPTAAIIIPESYAILWSWWPVAGASGYMWNTSNDPGTALVLEGSDNITYFETGLNCQTAYTRYVWAYDECGISAATTFAMSTTNEPPDSPAAATHVASVTEITWNWNAVEGASGYKWNTTNNYSTATDMGSATSKTETGLTCNTPYTRYVWAYNNCAASTPTTLSQATSAIPPAAPVAATHVPSSSQIIWNWTAVTGATGYKWNTTSNYATATDVGNTLTRTETGLNCNTAYTRYVWAYTACGNSTATPLNQTTSVNPASPVAGTHVPSSSQIIWNWTAVTGATGYKWSITNNYATATDIGNTLTRTETGLNCNTPYTRYIWAYNACSNSTATTLTQTTSVSPASPVAGTHVPSATQIIWNWTAVTGATGYKWSTTDNYASATDMGTSLTRTETGLTCNTPYTRYVWAYNTCGNSTATTLSQTTLTEPPAAPGSGTHIFSPTQIVWNWNTVPGAAGYKWHTSNNYTAATDMGTSLTTTETGLTCNTPYTRYVWAYSNCGVSAPTTLTGTTSLNPPLAPGSGTHVPSSSQIVWNWNTVTGATGYKWHTTNEYASATDMGINISNTETGLTCSTPYTRYVWAYSNCGVSTSTTLTQTTTNDPPAAPGSGTHIASPTQIVWNWNTVAGATGYKWNTSNNYTTATDMGTSTSNPETGLTCNTPYTRYVWAYNGCNPSAPTTLTQSTSLNPPASPGTGTHVPSGTQIVWNWNTVAGAAGYKWSAIDDFDNATEMGTLTSKTETGLTCNTPYTRYVWAYSNCGVSTSTTLTQATSTIPPAAPGSGTHVPSSSQIIWNWNTVADAAGYKWNTSNNYATATEMGTNTSNTETGLSCGTPYTRYVWAYNSCGVSTSTTLSQTTTSDPPTAPGAGTHVASSGQIIWNWTAVSEATGYKWGITNIYASATDVGNSLTWTESGLACNTPYTRYVWAYNSCGASSSITLTQSTADDLPATPTAGTHVPSLTQIIWNWNAVSDATGYKWSPTNDFGSASDMGTNTSNTETSLECGTNYTRYAWAYNSCGNSTPVTLTQSTSNCWSCGSSLPITHVGGSVAPVNKTVTYGTVTNIPGETSKCWITRNLGASRQALSVSDATELSAGWYWQFNRKQGYKHDGTTRTPSTTWISSISEYTDWTSSNDPCALELSDGWRLPTRTEWENVDANGNWTTWSGPYGSALKMHAAGYLYYTSGALNYRGTDGGYWSSTQSNTTNSRVLYFLSSSCIMTSYNKPFGFPVRCVRD